jgi:hypothetical protein
LFIGLAKHLLDLRSDASFLDLLRVYLPDLDDRVLHANLLFLLHLFELQAELHVLLQSDIKLASQVLDVFGSLILMRDRMLATDRAATSCPVIETTKQASTTVVVEVRLLKALMLLRVKLL